MMHKAWSSIEEVPYCFSRSSVKFQGHTALKIVEFDPNWAFPDCNSSLNSPMAMKCCTKLETAKERCPIVFQGHPSNFKVTRDKTSPILTQIGRFRTIGRSQLSNPSDLPCFIKGLIEEKIEEERAFQARRAVQTSNRQERTSNRRNHGDPLANGPQERDSTAAVAVVEPMQQNGHEEGKWGLRGNQKLIHGSGQDCSISSAKALEILQSCPESSKYTQPYQFVHGHRQKSAG